MASIINADSGISSSVTGITFSADNSGALNIQTNGVTAIAISSSQAVSFPATTSLNFGSANITNLTVSTLTVSGVGVFPAGTAASPSISFTGNTNTGIYLSATGAVSISTVGTQRLLVNASGNVGLGTAASIYGSDYRVINAGNGANYSVFYGSSNSDGGSSSYGQSGFGNNFYDSPSSKYAGNGAASVYLQSGGRHRFYTSASGTAGNSISFTESMQIDSSGNLVLGGTLSNWQSGRRVIQIVPSTTQGHVAFNGTISNVSTNAFVDATDARWEYIGNGLPALYQQDDGRHIWYTAASGTANSAISWSQVMTLTADGNLGVGTSSPTTFSLAGKHFEVDGGANNFAFIHARTTNVRGFFAINDTDDLAALYTYTNHPLLFGTNNTERARITSGGDFLVGRTSTINSSKILAQGNSYGWVGTNSGVDGTYIDWFAIAPYAADTNEQHRIRVTTSSIAGSSGIQFMISDGGGASTQTESFRINRTSCTVVGSLSKGSGSFKIDHPLKPDTHHLVHSFIEGPQADLIYRGKVTLVNGKATINIDSAAGMTEGTFVALCREVQCLTSNESDWDAVRGTIAGNILTIECQNANSSATISWVVIGERKDKHMYDTDWTDENGKVIVEPEKVKH